MILEKNGQNLIRNSFQKVNLNSELLFLMYIYYAFDNRPGWFKAVWRISDKFRKIISKVTFSLKFFVSQVIAIFIYFPLSRLSNIIDMLGIDVESIPLSSYRDKSFYSLRTDSLDRFSTKLEHRFTKSQIRDVLIEAGLEKIQFRDRDTYWRVIEYKKN